MARDPWDWKNVSGGSSNAGSESFGAGARMLAGALDNLQAPLKEEKLRRETNVKRESAARTGSLVDQILQGKDPELSGYYDSRAVGDARYKYKRDQEAADRANAAAARAAAASARARRGEKAMSEYAKFMMMTGQPVDQSDTNQPTDIQSKAYDPNVAGAAVLDKILKGYEAGPDVDPGIFDPARQGSAIFTGGGTGYQMPTAPTPQEVAAKINTPESPGAPRNLATREPKAYVPAAPAFNRPAPGGPRNAPVAPRTPLEAAVEAPVVPPTPETFERFDVEPKYDTLQQLATDKVKDQKKDAGEVAYESLVEAGTPMPTTSAGDKVRKDVLTGKIEGTTAEKIALKKTKVQEENEQDRQRTIKFAEAYPSAAKFAYDSYQQRKTQREATLVPGKMTEAQKGLFDLELAKKYNELGFDKNGKPFNADKTTKKGKVPAGDYISSANNLMKNINLVAGGEDANIDFDNQVIIRDMIVDKMAKGYTYEAINYALSKSVKGGSWLSYITGYDEMQVLDGKFQDELKAYSKASGKAK